MTTRKVARTLLPMTQEEKDRWEFIQNFQYPTISKKTEMRFYYFAYLAFIVAMMLLMIFVF